MARIRQASISSFATSLGNIIRQYAYLTVATIIVYSEDKAGFYNKLFRNLPRKHNETVRIFGRGDYYST